VEYTNPDDAHRAVAELNNYEIKPHKRIGVVMSKDNCRLFVGKLPKDKSGEEIREAMSRCTANVVDVIVHPSYKDNTKNRGYAFVEYSTHRDAAMARRKLLPGKFKLFDCEIQVDWAQPEAEVDPDTMSKVTNLYVRGLDPDYDSEAALGDLFSFTGRTGIPLHVEKVKKIKDFAFIHFETRQQAEIALQLAQNDIYFGHQLSPDGRTRLQVVWAKPADRMQKPRTRPFRSVNQISPSLQDYNSYRNMSYTPGPMFHPNNRMPFASDWSEPIHHMGGRQRQNHMEPDHPFRMPNQSHYDRSARSAFEWSTQPQVPAGGDRGHDVRGGPAHPRTNIWAPAAGFSMSPYGMPSPAASPALLPPGLSLSASPAFRSMSPFTPSPNPFQSFRPFPPQAV
jgi:RNA recognition motif-containing protein